MLPASFHYEQKDQNFPEVGVPRRNGNSGIGKILSRYQAHQNQGPVQDNRNKIHSVHAGTALNYSQIYNDIKMQKSISSQQIPNAEQQLPFRKQPNNIHIKQQPVVGSPYHFQSAVGMGIKMNKKKVLPGITTPRDSHDRSYQEPKYRSEYAGVNQSAFSEVEGMKDNQNVIVKQRSKNFRINDVKDQNSKRINYQQVQDLYLSDNEQQTYEAHSYDRKTNKPSATQSEAYFMNKISKSKPVKDIGKITDKQKQNNLEQKQTYFNKYYDEEKQGESKEYQNKRLSQMEQEKKREIQRKRSKERAMEQEKGKYKQKVVKERQLKNHHVLEITMKNESDEREGLQKSRSIGVGNHRINSEDLVHSFHQESVQKPTRMNSPRDEEKNKKKVGEQKMHVLKQNTKQSQQSKKSAHFNFNAAEDGSIQELNHMSKAVEEQNYSQSKINISIQDRANISIQDRANISIQDRANISIQDRANISIQDRANISIQDRANIFIQDRANASIKNNEVSKFQDVIVHYREVDRVEANPSQQEWKIKNQMQRGIDNESRVASTIKQVQQYEEEGDQKHRDQLEDNLLNDIEIIQDNQELQVHQPPQEVPQKIPEPEEYVCTFSIEHYMQVYPVLKSIQTALKAQMINAQDMLRGIKKYLQVIAAGSLDNIDEFNLALHKKKIVKNSLFLERVAIIVLAFSYVSNTVRESHKFLLNIVAYSLNNSLILLKVLEESQIGDNTKKSHVILHKKQQTLESSNINSVMQKSDRLLMKRNLDTLRNNNDVLLDSIHKLSKCDEVFYDNLKQIVKLINKSSLEQTFYNLLEYFSFYLNVSELEHMIPFLAVAPNPYLSAGIASSRNSMKYTLVVDVLELFCLGTKKSKTSVFRPYSQHFLHEMSQYYQIVAFSIAFPNNVDKVIDMLDPKGYIKHRLYKHHAVNKLKEVDRIGRDIDQIILLDNQNGGGQGSYDNCIHVPGWKGSKNDTILAELCPLLAMIALKRVKACDGVRKVREQSFKNKQNGVKYINYGITLD